MRPQRRQGAQRRAKEEDLMSGKTLSCGELPRTDPTPIFEAFRGSYSTELLVAAVAHFNLFSHLVGGRLSFDDLRGRLKLAERPANVLFTALRAMGLMARDSDGRLALTALAAEHLTPGGQFEVSD